MRVQVVPHDSTWIVQFEAEAAQIADALAENAVSIHHVGSTAIPGMHAKPVIDLLVEVHDIAQVDEKNSAMEALGYKAMGEFGLPGRRYFHKANSAGVGTHHVHAFEADSGEVARHLAFRDYLIAHPEDAKEYGELKSRLARDHPDDIEAYMDGKDPFIKDMEAKALEWSAFRE